MPTTCLDKTQAPRKPIASLQRDYRPLRGMAKPPSQTLPPHEGEGLGLGIKIVHDSDGYYRYSQRLLEGVLQQLPAGRPAPTSHLHFAKLLPQNRSRPLCISAPYHQRKSYSQKY